MVGADEYILLLSDGDVFQLNGQKGSSEHLFSINSSGFDSSAPSSIYALDGNVVVVNKHKTEGVLYRDGDSKIALFRGNYYADISHFPIALFKDAAMSFMIYGVDWNHIQIMNVDTLQIVTADKSLIEENAETWHKDFYKRMDLKVTTPWPKPYDYFYGELLMSPDEKHFLSKGWNWGSRDAYTIYNVADFIGNNRISYKTLGYWEHVTRGACWVDDNTVAVPYWPGLDEEEESTDKSVELHFYDIQAQKPELVKRLVLEFNDIGFEKLFFYKKANALICLDKENGLTIIDLDGAVLARDSAFHAEHFYPEMGLFLSWNDRSLVVHQIE